VLGLHLPDMLRRSLTTTNSAECLISRIRHMKRNVKRWRGGQMVMTWEGSPMAGQAPPGWAKKILHAGLASGDGVLEA